MFNAFNTPDGDFNTLHKSADIAMLMTNGGDACGIAYLDVVTSGQTLGVVAKSCATGYYSLFSRLT
jgi:hypothetical protein